MANLQETPEWEDGIYQFEQTDVVQGGPTGIDNVPTGQLANRTAYLKQEQDNLKKKFDSGETPDPLPQYPLSSKVQMLPYSSTRTYKQNETCTTFDAVTGELQIWTSYAPSDNKGHDPQDPTNRHEQWANFPTPCWWIKAHGVEPGTPTFWPSDDIPENALQIMDTDIDASFYHRIAKAHPSLVSDGKINLADLLGRYVRVADGSSYAVNTTHEDAIRNISGKFGLRQRWAGAAQAINASEVGVFEKSGFNGDSGLGTIASGGSETAEASLVGFDASNVVPTAAQNQPKSTMMNFIIFM